MTESSGQRRWRVLSQIDAWEQEYNEADEWTDRLTEYLSEWNAADEIL